MMLRLPRARWEARRKIAFVLGAYGLLRLALLATARLTPDRDDTLLIALAIGGSIWVALIVAALLAYADTNASRC